MTLRDWLAARWIEEHQSSRKEIADLFAIADQNLRDSQVAAISADLQLSAAYNAALQLATAALAAAGYRIGRDRHHERTIQSLAFTLGIDADQIRRFDVFRRKRNLSWYERAGGTSDQEVASMRRLAEQLRREVPAWITARHPDLL